MTEPRRPVRRTFPGEPEQVQHAREFVTRRLAAAGCPEGALRDIQLCVAELCNNAVTHTLSGLGGSFTVTVHLVGTTVHVEVADAGPTSSQVPAGEPENGWGLGLVAGLAHRKGRVTWFAFDW